MSAEHDFGEDVLKAGEKLRSFTAETDISQRQAVKITGDYQVGVAGAGDSIVGVAAYDVAAGQEVDVIMDDCEVLVDVGGTGITAGSDVEVVGTDGAFQDADSGDAVGLALEAAADGEFGNVYLTDAGGN